MGYSRWVLADLQVHTPADFHQKYGNVGGPTPNAAFAETLIKARAAAGVSVIAVTDHNTLDWYSVLAEAGRRHGVTDFPGIECVIGLDDVPAGHRQAARDAEVGAASTCPVAYG